MTEATSISYACPMHPDQHSDRPGVCSKCGMQLIPSATVSSQIVRPVTATVSAPAKNKLQTFLPLIIIFSLITSVSLIQVWVSAKASLDGYTPTPLLTFSSGLRIFMASFMGGFFLVFGGFKLLDLKGFAHGFQTYDVIAKRVYGYGLVYPFIELTLGFLILLQVSMTLVSIAALVISLIGVVGVGLKLRKKERIQCVCLGTVFDLPLTNITLFENTLMAIMAIGMMVV